MVILNGPKKKKLVFNGNLSFDSAIALVCLRAYKNQRSSGLETWIMLGFASQRSCAAPGYLLRINIEY